MEQVFLVGTYTEPILFGTGDVFRGKGEGVYLCALHGTEMETVAVLPAVNPSFVCADEERCRLYAVHETKEWEGRFGGGVSQWRYDGDGAFTLEETRGTGGTDPCHLSVSPDGRWLAVANYSSGAMTAFALDAQGRISSAGRVFQHTGSSVNRARQEGPHAHGAIFGPDGLLYVPDLGMDRVMCYRCGDGEDGIQPCGEQTLIAAPGSGPRYAEFSPDGNHLYIIHELASEVTHYIRTNRGMEHRETVSTLPSGFAGESIGADLHLTPDGRYLYASNRGHDSLAMFRVEPDGSLASLGWQPCGGRTPRNFAVSPEGGLLLVGNQDTDNITAFAIGKDGRLRQTGDYPFPTPVCIRFLRKWR